MTADLYGKNNTSLSNVLKISILSKVHLLPFLPSHLRLPIFCLHNFIRRAHFYYFCNITTADALAFGSGGIKLFYTI